MSDPVINVTNQNAAVIVEDDQVILALTNETIAQTIFHGTNPNSSASVWGQITGSIADQTDLISLLSNYALAATVIDLTEDITLGADDSGNIYTNIGAAGQVIVTIGAVRGFEALFIVTNAFELRIAAASGDVLYDGNLAATYTKSAKIGSVLEVFATDTTNIFITSAKGEWRTT